MTDEFHALAVTKKTHAGRRNDIAGFYTFRYANEISADCAGASNRRLANGAFHWIKFKNIAARLLKFQQLQDIM